MNKKDKQVVLINAIETLDSIQRCFQRNRFANGKKDDFVKNLRNLVIKELKETYSISSYDEQLVQHILNNMYITPEFNLWDFYEHHLDEYELVNKKIAKL